MDFRSSKSRRVDVVVEMTPLIDVVFLLLIFFMITTTFINSPGIEVELPKANSSDSAAGDEDLVVAIDEEGRIIFQHRQVSLDELQADLEGMTEKKQKSTIIVQADTKTQHGIVVQVMDAAKQAGFSRLAVATQQD